MNQNIKVETKGVITINDKEAKCIMKDLYILEDEKVQSKLELETKKLLEFLRNIENYKK